MKKIFTLIAMAITAISANAQLPENVYPYADITWGDITWKNGNNKTDINDEAGTKLYFVMGQGNAYEQVYCESFVSEDSGEEVNRPYYTYVDYENGATGVPGYGLYYKFTPAVAGKLKVLTWVNKGNRKTVVVKGSTGTPLALYTDVKVSGYINGQKANYETPAVDPETGEQKLDNQGNPIYEQYCIFFDNDAIKARVDAENAKRAEAGNNPISPFVVDLGNQAFWGWLEIDVEAGESYYFFQLSSQLGFGGYDFTPAGGETESYVAALDMGGTIVLAPEFANAVDENNVAKPETLTNQGSVINIATANVAVEAVGSSTPTAITPNKETGISAPKAADLNSNAPVFNLAGQQVTNGFKGMVIQNGKKFVVK
ncbi:MAG: hypothetical protein IJ155_07745 [Prevotella sp.]|nr:hypothetical protein [Prevotella sp.]